MNSSVIYLDNNATTQLDQRVLHAMMPFLTDNFANANSTHLFGVAAYEEVKMARLEVANLIASETNEVVFTSGATEAINLAIKGVAENYLDKGKHIITIATEHSAILDTCRYLETRGFEVTYLSVENDGLVDVDKFKKALRTDTILSSVMLVNNETGIIQPIAELARLSHEVGAFFMTDATQAVGKIEINVDRLDVDLLTMSAHKFYGPKGVGALFVRQRSPRRIKIPALLHGGGHERGLRSGTLNVPGIVGLGHACRIAKDEMKNNAKNIQSLRDYLESELLKIPDTHVNGNVLNRLYNVTNICFKGADSDAIIMGLSNSESDVPLIAVSNGSACTSTSIEPSHVLMAMGLSEVAAFNSIRFSLGKSNTRKEIEIVINAVRGVVSSLRQMVS